MSIEKEVCTAFDITLEKAHHHDVPVIPQIHDEYNILLIVGASGSGKTSIIKNQFGFNNKSPQWSEKSICEHFPSFDDAKSRLGAVGLNSIPAWLKPYHLLSTGEQFRADLAISLKDNTVIDEFTSVVDRNVAKSACVSLNKYVKSNDIKNLVLASCHRDIIEWLEPDLVYDVDTQELTDYRRGLRRNSRPDIILHFHELAKHEKSKVWEIFKKHHYLSESFNKSARCFVAYWGDVLVGFTSCLAMPSGSIQNAYREHRTVVLPDFQGLGIGARISDCLGDVLLSEGKRFFSRTTHFRLGEYREKSQKWKPTSKNKVLRKDIKIKEKQDLYNNYQADNKRICYSHEYIGK